MSSDIGIGNGLSVDPPDSDVEHHSACPVHEDNCDNEPDIIPVCYCDDIYDGLAMDAAEAKRDAYIAGDY